MKSSAARSDANREREREPTEERQPLLAQLRCGLCHDEPAERLRAAHELDWLDGSDETAILSRGRELDDDLAIAVQLRVAEGAPREARQAEALAREERGPDVVQLVPGCELELLGRELGRLGALVGGAKGRFRVQRREAGGLPAELADGLCSRRILEET